MSRFGTNGAGRVNGREQNVEIMRMPHQTASASTPLMPNMDISGLRPSVCSAQPRVLHHRRHPTIRTPMPSAPSHPRTPRAEVAPGWARPAASAVSSVLRSRTRARVGPAACARPAPWRTRPNLRPGGSGVSTRRTLIRGAFLAIWRNCADNTSTGEQCGRLPCAVIPAVHMGADGPPSAQNQEH